MTMTVTIRMRTVGQRFATVGQLVNGAGRVLAETVLAPYGFTGAVVARAEAIATSRGWLIREAVTDNARGR